MRIAVIGTGGVGGYFGGRLAAAGNEVTFVARGAHFDAMRTKGLSVFSARGDMHLQPVHVVQHVNDIDAVDLVLVAVKLWDMESVALSLSPLVERGAAVLSLQNGIQKDELLRKYLAPEAVLGGTCYISSMIERPGVIRHSGLIQRLVFGEYDGHSSARSEVFLATCKRASIDVEISEEIERLIWDKFVFLVALSGTTAAMRQTIGPILKNAQTRSFLLDVVREVADVGRASGIPFGEAFADQQLALFDSLPKSMTSSMHRDLEQGNRLELPWLSGAVVELGKSYGIETPLNRAVSDILAPYSSGKG